jgi:hypothetical protein
MAAQRTKNWGFQVALCAGVLTWQIYDISTATEARPQALMLLEWLAIGLAFLGLVGGLVMLARGNATRG